MSEQQTDAAVEGQDLTVTANLDAALAAVQAQLPDVPKTKRAVIEKKSGGSYTYDYADLADISRAILPLLGRVGLSWTTRPTLAENNRMHLVYELRHVGGEKIEGVYPLPASADPKEIGSAITYARRYTLCCVTGVAPEDDDDGAAASQAAARGRRTAQRRAQPDRQEQAGPPARTAQRAQHGGPPLPGEPGYDQQTRPGPADQARWLAAWKVRFEAADNVADLERLGRELNDAVRAGRATEETRGQLRSALRHAAEGMEATAAMASAEPPTPAPEAGGESEAEPEGVGVTPEELARYERGEQP